MEGLRKALIRGWKYDWKVARLLVDFVRAGVTRQTIDRSESLTEEPSSGRGKQSFRVRDRHGRSKR